MSEADKRINMKTCTKCKVDKEITEFSKDKQKKDGIYPSCKECESKAGRIYYTNNKEKESKRKKIYYINNKEKIDKRNKFWFINNKEEIRKKSKIYYEKNKVNCLSRAKIYRKNNREAFNKTARIYEAMRLKTDPMFKLKKLLRDRTSKAFKHKGYKKTSKTQEMLGVDWEVCKAHIERQFKKGMNWSNYGEWHIDHIIPLSSAKNEKDLRKLCHYRNLQPLWAVDNLSKSDKIIGQQSFMRI